MIYKSGKRLAQCNMDFDALLLTDLHLQNEPVLHLYDWEKDSITYGYFFKPERWLNLEFLKNQGVDLARRPTGGGCVFHMCDFAFSILIPASYPAFSLNTLENYAFINRMVITVLRRFLLGNPQFKLLSEETPPKEGAFTHFCMAKPTKYDVMLDGKKVAGAAQRKTKEGYLHQGTIFLTKMAEPFLRDLLSVRVVADGIRDNSFPLLEGSPTTEEILSARKTLSTLFEDVFLETVQQE